MADVEMASCFPDVPEGMVWEASCPRLTDTIQTTQGQVKWGRGPQDTIPYRKVWLFGGRVNRPRQQTGEAKRLRRANYYHLGIC